jgi:hypothetical protein
LPGTLAELEHAVALAERAPSLEAAANRLRLDIELPGALRWLRRRLARVHQCLVLVIGLLPDRLAGCAARLTGAGERLGQDAVLSSLRALVADQLPHLPAPLGFYPPGGHRGGVIRGVQQPMGPDPPLPWR